MLIIIFAARMHLGPSKPDIPPDRRWRNPMKNLFLAALAAVSLTAAIAPVASAAAFRGGG
jgi:hypothetical protein